jgi:hypothetical protein
LKDGALDGAELDDDSANFVGDESAKILAPILRTLFLLQVLRLLNFFRVTKVLYLLILLLMIRFPPWKSKIWK